MSVLGAPLANLGMRFGKTLVGSEMDSGRHTSWWQLRALNAVVADKGLGYLRPDLDRPVRVQIQSDMAAWLREASGASE